MKSLSNDLPNFTEVNTLLDTKLEKVKNFLQDHTQKETEEIIDVVSGVQDQLYSYTRAVDTAVTETTKKLEEKVTALNNNLEKKVITLSACLVGLAVIQLTTLFTLIFLS